MPRWRALVLSTNLGVALSTIGTNVCLYVLRLLMLGYVVEQGLLVGETFIAGVTLVGFVSLMTAGVGLQVGQLGEGLGATCNRISPVSFLSS